MPKTPTHDVYFVVKKPGAKDGTKKRDVWTRIGAAWRHGDSKGFDVHFELMPYELLTDKRLVLREREEKVVT
jgi:hypothetical protein